jgi:hypothetical protein
MKDYSSITASIARTFESNLLFMRSKYQYHYALRKWRIDNDQKYVQPIFIDFQMRTLKMIPKINKMDDPDYVKKESEKMLLHYPTEPEKKAKRREIYAKKPEILFYSNILHYIFLAKTYSVDILPEYKPYMDKAIKILKDVDLKSLFLDEGFIEHNPSGSANDSYYLKYLGIDDYEPELLEKFKSFWLNRKTNTHLQFINKIYGMTHLVIAASYYYQQIVDKEKMKWILTFFEKEIDTIIREANADVVAEVGLCFRLCGIQEHPVIDACREHIAKFFNPERGVITKEESVSTLERLEHRNVISLLLFSSYESFNLGPNIALFIREKDRTLYIPEKGHFIGYEEDED